MKQEQTIIDVTPLEYSSSRNPSGTANSTQAHSSSQSGSYRQPSWKTASAYRDNESASQVHYGSAYTRFPADAPMGATGSILGGFARMAVGVSLIAIGIPMLILPGPGLLSIGAGVLLATSGARRVFG